MKKTLIIGLVIALLGSITASVIMLNHKSNTLKRKTSNITWVNNYIENVKEHSADKATEKYAAGKEYSDDGIPSTFNFTNLKEFEDEGIDYLLYDLVFVLTDMQNSGITIPELINVIARTYPDGTVYIVEGNDTKLRISIRPLAKSYTMEYLYET